MVVCSQNAHLGETEGETMINSNLDNLRSSQPRLLESCYSRIGLTGIPILKPTIFLICSFVVGRKSRQHLDLDPVQMQTALPMVDFYCFGSGSNSFQETKVPAKSKQITQQRHEPFSICTKPNQMFCCRFFFFESRFLQL